MNTKKLFYPLVVIPLYNHAQTVKRIVEESLEFCKDIMVVDDGSTDLGIHKIEKLPVNIIHFKKNKGKGAAIIAAADWAIENKFTHIITIDADGQHYAHDIPRMMEASEQNPNTIIIGKRRFGNDNADIPTYSKFGRKFSGFWAKVQTSQKIMDMQSGYRVYPLEVFGKFKIYTRRFTFEIEIIIKAIWAGFKVEEIDVDVHYPRKSERISHFRMFFDNARLSVLNTYLTIRAMLPIPHRKYLENEKGEIISLNPFKVVVEQMKKKENPFHLALSAAWGSFWGTIALPGIRTMILFVGAGWFNLNRAVVFSADKLAMPPFIPFVCIEAGYFIRHGKFLTEVSWQIIGREFFQRVWEWILGSLIVAPVFGILVGCVVFVIGHILRKGFIYGSKMDR